MSAPTRDQIRRIFLDGAPSVSLREAAELLGVRVEDLRRDIDDGVILAASAGGGVRVGREELIAAAMGTWEQAAIEEALGDDAVRVLPEAVRLVLLSVRVPRYQRDVLAELAQRHGTTLDEVVARELEDVVCAHAEELGRVVPGLESALAWPRTAGEIDAVSFTADFGRRPAL